MVAEKDSEGNQLKVIGNISPISSKRSSSVNSKRADSSLKKEEAEFKPKEEKETTPVNVKEESEEELMEYYEVGDLVFAESDRGYFEPAEVVKTLNEYTQYKVQFFSDKQHKVYVFAELKDYDENSRKTFEKMAETASAKDAEQMKKSIMLAEKKLHKS